MTWLHRWVGIKEKPRTISKRTEHVYWAHLYCITAIQHSECEPGSEEEAELRDLMRWIAEKAEQV